MGDLPGLSALELAGMVRSGQASARELVEAHLARLDQVNDDLNAVITRREDQALAEADTVDRGVADGADLPLAGVPFTVKDLIAAAGVRTTAGTRSLEDFVPRMDATAVGRLRAAGAILIGKTNCPEWGMFPYTRNERFGETKNPLGPVTVGGSSGGEAAAVSAGASALGVGTDFGGSVRWPAHCTGLFGLRPTAGRIPLTGQLPTVSLDEPLVPNEVTLQGRAQLVGPLARTVDDVEQALHVMAGPDGIDPFASPVALGWSRQVTLTELRATVWTGPSWPALRDDVATAIRDAGRVLEKAGVDVDAVEPPGLDRGVEVYSELRSWDRLQDVRRLIRGKEEMVGADVRAAIEATERFESEPHAREAALVWEERDRLRADLLAFLRERPIVLMAVATVPPYPLDGPAPQVGGRDQDMWEVLAPSRVISLFGFPGLSVPLGRSADGWPIGVQVVGRPFREDEVLAVARALLEEAGG